MDGINGITGGYSLIVTVALWYINNYQITFVDNDFIYFTGIALLVFDFFNFRKKAKCFAGDVGAVSIAFIIIFLLGFIIILTGDITYIVLLAVYGVDTILTIIHRLMLKENISQAHRKHAYQIMANELKIPHLAVSAIYMILQGMICIGYFALFPYRYIYVIAVFGILSIAYLIFMKKYFHLHLNK